MAEFSGIDGAFVLREDGVVEAAGMYLQTSSQSVEIPRGPGARHRSAAAVTALTKAAAVTVSESSSKVTVFHGGRILVEIEKPRPIGRDTPAKQDFHGDQGPGLDVETDARPGQ